MVERWFVVVVAGLEEAGAVRWERWRGLLASLKITKNPSQLNINDLVCYSQSQAIQQFELSDMGNSNTHIQTSLIPIKQLALNNQLPVKSSHKVFRKFGQKVKKSDNQSQKITLSVEQPFSEYIDIETSLYEELQDAFTHKTQSIVIDGIIRDRNVAEHWFFQCSNAQNRITLAIRPFASQDSFLFDSILCQVYFSALCSSLDSPNLHKMRDNYTINTPIEIEQPNSHILVMERVDISLSQIIAFKREKKWDWQVNQFQRLTSDLINAVSMLHSNRISHNDIRPSNIFFSLQNNQYVLSGYSNCIKVGKAKGSNRIMQNTQQIQNAAALSETDLLKSDIHALGMTLLSAFYLCENVSLNLTKELNEQQGQKYDIFKLIKTMVDPAAKRSDILQIKNLMPRVNYQYESMANMIDLIKHRKESSSEEMTEQKKAVGWAYQRLGLWNQWKKQYEQVFELQSNNCSDLKKAECYYQLALIEHCIGQEQNSSVRAKKAAEIFRQLGEEQQQIGATSIAEVYYKKALDCAKYYEEPHDIDVSRTLNGLSNLHAHKREFRLAKTLAAEVSNVIAKNPNGKDSFQWCESRIKEAKLQTDSGSYEAADNILNDCFKFAQKKEGLNNRMADNLKAIVCAQKGRGLLMKAENDKRDQTLLLEQAEKQLGEALKIEMNIDEDRHQQMAYVIKMLGEINFKRLNYEQAVKDFNKSIELINYIQAAQTKRTKEKPDLLCLRAIAESHLGESQKAAKDIQNALLMYRQLYGSDHNRSSALAIKALGKVYQNNKQEDKAKECQRISRQLLEQLGSDTQKRRNEQAKIVNDDGKRKNSSLEQRFNISQILHQ